MKKFLAILTAALVAFGQTGVAYAQSGQPMMHRLNDDLNIAQQEFISLLRESLRSDPEGDAFIRGSSCATPNDFVEAIRRHHPDVVLENAQALPGYVASLHVRRADSIVGPGEERIMSRMICSEPGSTRTESDIMDVDGFARELSLGEYVLFDANIGEIILAGNCTNVVGPASEEVPEEPEVQEQQVAWYDQCVFVPALTQVGRQYQWAYFHRDSIPAGNTQNCRVLCPGQMFEDGSTATNMDACIRVPRPCTGCRWEQSRLPRAFREVQDSGQWTAEWALTMVGISRADIDFGGYFGICGHENENLYTGVPIFEPSDLAEASELGYWTLGPVMPIWDGVSFQVGDTHYTRDRRGRDQVTHRPLLGN